MKKRTITLTSKDGGELVFTARAFDYAYFSTDEKCAIVCICGDEFLVKESCQQISELIDNAED